MTIPVTRRRPGRPATPDRAVMVAATIAHRDALSRKVGREINALVDTHVLRGHVAVRWLRRVAAARKAIEQDLRTRIIEAGLVSPRDLPAYDALVAGALSNLIVTPADRALAEAEERHPTPEEPRAVVRRSPSLLASRAQHTKLRTRLLDLRARIAPLGSS